MKTVKVNNRLRPLRLAYLLKPNNRAGLRKIIQTNTCLWGGRFNPIIPIYKKKPSFFGDHYFRKSAKDVVMGYIDAFEPDYFVDVDGSFKGFIDLPKDRVIKLPDIINHNAEDHISHGLSVNDIFFHLHRKTFQFVLKKPPKIIYPEKNDNLGLLVSATYGEFPSDKNFKYLKQNYFDVFDAKEVPVDQKNFLKELKFLNPLKIGSYEIESRSHQFHRGNSFFFMDGDSTSDIIDYWNLRAIGWKIIPLPIQWQDSLSQDCSKIIKRNHSQADKKFKDHSTSIICSQKLDFKQLQEFTSKLQGLEKHALSLQHWYPRVWDDWARDKDGVTRGELKTRTTETEINYSDDNIHLQIKTVSPEFAEEYTKSNASRWANVITFRDYSSDTDLAAVIPPNIKEPETLVGRSHFEKVNSHREGLILEVSSSSMPHFIDLPTSLKAFEIWMKERGYKIELSEKGRLSKQIIKTLGGVHYIQIIRNKALLETINKMAHSDLEIEVEHTSSEESQIEKKKVRAKTIPVETLEGLIKRENSREGFPPRLSINRLVESNVLTTGLRIQCSNCLQHSFFDLQQLQEKLNCPRCLQQFSFPIYSPKKETAWMFNTKGPFSVENYAMGNYTVLFALKFFYKELNSSISWLPSFKLFKSDKDTKGIDIDFGLFLQQMRFGISTTGLILGECKSMKNEFKEIDFNRMKQLADMFPGSVLAFCTMRDVLTKKEKSEIKKLAYKGRKDLKTDFMANPVLVLTGTELFEDIPHCWKKLPPPHNVFSQDYDTLYDIQKLCDVTQQIHLGMESYSQWREKEFEKMRKRRQVRTKPSN